MISLDEKTSFHCECNDESCELRVSLTDREFIEILRREPKVYMRSNECSDKSGTIVETHETYSLWGEQ